MLSAPSCPSPQWTRFCRLISPVVTRATRNLPPCIALHCCIKYFPGPPCCLYNHTQCARFLFLFSLYLLFGSFTLLRRILSPGSISV